MIVESNLLHFYAVQEEHPGSRIWWDILCSSNSEVRISEVCVLFLESYHLKLIFVFSCSESVVSAGIFRIFGAEVAELPLVATETNFQGQVAIICSSH